jgi:hypothetical protein
MVKATFNFPRGFLWGTATASHQVEGNNTNNNWHGWEQEAGRIANGDTAGLDPGFFTNPSLRDLNFAINASIGQGEFGLTGVPTDIAFDNHRNQSALTNFSTNFSAGFPLSLNGKSLVKPVAAGFASVNTPQFLFASVPTSAEGPGVVDVIFLEGGFQRFDTDPFLAGIQSVPVPGVRKVMDYFRQ